MQSQFQPVASRPGTLETEIERELALIRQDTEINAQTAGRRNLPQPESDTMSFYWEEPHYRLARLLERIDGELSFEAVCYRVFEAQKETAFAIREQENALDEAKRKAVILKGEQKQVEALRAQRKPRWLLPAVIIISLLEGAGMLPVWEVMGFSLIVSAIYSVLFAGFMTLLSHLYPSLLELIPNRKVKWITTGIFFSAMLFVFKETGDIRTGYLRETADAGSVSPWLFAILSVLFLITSIALCYFFYPRKTKAQRDAEMRYREIIRAQRDNDREIARLERGITDARNALRKMKEEAGAVITRGAYLENQVVSAALEMYGAYKRKNFLYRTDGKKPSCFDDPYPFDFNLKFQSIFHQLSHETPR